MVKLLRLRLRSALALAIGLAAIMLLAGCGRSGHRVAPPRQSGGQAFQAATTDSLDDALAELNALETPEGVDPALFAELKDALGKALVANLRGRRGAETPPYKTASSPPTGNTNRIEDLACSLDDGEYALTWLYRNCGDYDQNGAVGIEDISPMAIHFGEDAAPENEWIDGDSDGRVHISDITPIAMNFAANVHHYSVQGSHFFSSSFTEVAKLEFPEDAPNDARLTLEHSLGAEPEYLYWRVVPVDDEGNPGDASNTTEVSEAPPPAVRILSVNPLGGVTGTEVTFSAVISGEAPFDYAWDFGGGADPDESTEASPTVTLGVVDTYDAQLSVENAEGSALKHFTLTVTAEPGEPPEIISVSPTEGDSGTEATFSAEVTGDGPFEYYWDFAGGASPNFATSASPTVTLSRGGTLPEPVVTYPASLTVTNSFGMTTHDFDLSVSARWHVEEIPQYGSPEDWVGMQCYAFADDGTFWAALELDEIPDGAGGRSLRVASLQGNTWQTHLIMDQPPADYPSLAVDSQGNPAISYAKGSLGGELWFARQVGDTWENDFVHTGGIFWPTSHLMFNSQDRAIISLSYTTDGGGEAKVARESPSGWEILDQEPGGWYVALRPNDNILAVYRTEDHHQLWLAEWWGTEWEHELVYEAQGDEWTGPYGMAVDREGLARILHTGGNSVGLQMAREQNIGGWDVEPVEGYPEDYREVSLVLGPNNLETILFYPQYQSADPWTLSWRDASTWSYQILPEDVYGNLMFHPEGHPVLVAGGCFMSSYW